jgi:2-phosphosulfolactate phosphatase
VPRTVDVVLTADTVVAAHLAGASALVIDVLRASTSMITALGNGASEVIPVVTVEEAHARRASLGGSALLAGERGGDPPEGFDLGNSPLEFTRERVDGRSVVMTTSNGTKALVAARPATRTGVAAFINARAAVAWAQARGTSIVLICSGEIGTLSLEDQACAGLLAARLADADPALTLTPLAEEARRVGVAYGREMHRLAVDAPHARTLIGKGRAADVTACLTLDTSAVVPELVPGVDKLVWGLR